MKKRNETRVDSKGESKGERERKGVNYVRKEGKKGGGEITILMTSPAVVLFRRDSPCAVPNCSTCRSRDERRAWSRRQVVVPVMVAVVVVLS